MAPMHDVATGPTRCSRVGRTRPYVTGLFLSIVLLSSLPRCERLSAGQTVADDPVAHAEYIAGLAAESEKNKAEAVLWAQRNGYPVRYDDGHIACELMAIRDDRPVYYATTNVPSAQSIATDAVRDVSPWLLDGDGELVGIWDEGTVRSSHQEFLKAGGGSRARRGSLVGIKGHATHVAGTIGAQGIDPNARGMAPAVSIQSLDWDSDAAGMALYAANTPGVPGQMFVSNHSYSVIGGWEYLPSGFLSAYTGWHWIGLWGGPQSFDNWPGMYNWLAQGWDDVAYVERYYLAFAAAGNDRGDNPPLGETVYYSKSNVWYPITFSPDTCPLGDGMRDGGYGTICGPGVAKNIMTVGAVGDAVFDGARSLADANMATFSSWGPTDDGRIKPDIVANGVGVYSTWSKSDDSYATASGTSMASPAATGSAVLLVQLYHRLFPGRSMRSSTLKGLIIHTADDLGRPGPDYQFGWGLMNTRAAAELIQKQHDDSAGDTILEGRVASFNGLNPNPDDSYYFYADGDDPIRVTLCWTDPPGVATDDHNSRTPRLVHDLNLRIVGPDRTTTYYPYILNVADPCAVATTGDNRLDNVEQVYIGTPGEPGVYEVQVTIKGTLANGEQYYSLISSAPLLSQMPLTAKDMQVAVPTDTEVTITLEATDDGLPSRPAKLTYVIVSLPQHGSLTYPNGSTITEPTPLANYGNKVVYTPDAGYTGKDTFSFYVDDGGNARSGGACNPATVCVAVRHLISSEYQVTHSEDDAHGLTSGMYQTKSAHILYVGQYVAAMRFRDLDIPPGSEIVAANLQICMLSWSTAQPILAAICAEATDNAANFAAANRDLSSLQRTQTAVAWNWEAGTQFNAITWRTSPDIRAVIQEVVDRPGWSEGNAIALIYAPDAFAGQVQFYAYDGEPSRAAKLQITYAPKEDGEIANPGQNPPMALSKEAYFSANAPASIILAATDDGLPQRLRFAICSLPAHGSLRYPDGTAISAPTLLAGLGNTVIYTPDAGFTGDDAFEFYADDGGSSPLGGISNTATITLKVRNMVTRKYEVARPEDDAYGTGDETILTGQTLSVGRYSSAMRFRNIDLPPQSEIVSARLRIYPAATLVESFVDGTLCAQAVGDANALSPDLRIPDLPRTQACVPWTWEAGQSLPQGASVLSPDIRAVVQEIVGGQDWSGGNSIAVLYVGGAYAGQDLEFLACDSPYAIQAPSLEITCTLPPGAEWVAPGNPPQVGAVRTQANAGEPITITLTAMDDGLPNPPGRLTYTILSLPTHGVLENPDGQQIAAPGPLPDFGNQVVYRAEPNFTGDDTFTFCVDDGGTRPTGGKSGAGSVRITVTIPGLKTVTRRFAVTGPRDDASATPLDAENSISDTRLRVGVATSAMRFTDVVVPQGCRIMRAKLMICMRTSVADHIEAVIHAEATGNAADFSGGNRYLCQLARTSASVAWFWERGATYGSDLPPGWVVGVPSPDIGAVVQEVIDRPDWATGHDMAIILSATNQPASDLEFYAYESGYPTYLEITYVP